MERKLNVAARRTILLIASIVGLACVSVAKADAAANTCGPYGDPSAAVISEVKPNCGHGELLGPWKDADGIDRYACLYAPATGSNRKLPIIVYLHPALFGGGTCVTTNTRL